MDPAGTPGHLDRRTAALSGVWLERTVELDNARLQVRDWPGYAGPIVHIPEPLADSELVLRIAAVFPPRCRLFSVSPRPDQAYQVHVADLHGVCAQFGFEGVVVVAEGLSRASALLLAAWHPEHVRALLLVGDAMAQGDCLLARSLRDCPPDWVRLRRGLRCPILEVPITGDDALRELQTLTA